MFWTREGPTGGSESAGISISFLVSREMICVSKCMMLIKARVRRREKNRVYSKQFFSATGIAVISLFGATMTMAQVLIPTVPIGNPGNAADPATGGLYGSVAYKYNIGSTEVTNAQYAAFLNAVAATDTNNLYNTNMAGSLGGITRSGSPGSYTYSTISGRANNPVNHVSFWDATRFANWLHNGQPTGPQNSSTTEDGAYTLTAGGISANTITRNAGWKWAVTSENEWYKAAYYQPASAGGDSDNYWLYPTSSNAVPTTAQANFFGNGINNTVPMGSYAPNFFGTVDMGGNVWEWNDGIISGSSRGLRGGSFLATSVNLRANIRSVNNPTNEFNVFGFRVSTVPEPSTIAVLALGTLVTLRRRRSAR